MDLPTALAHFVAIFGRLPKTACNISSFQPLLILYFLSPHKVVA